MGAALPVVPILVCVTVTVVFGTIGICAVLVWDKPPWWRTTPTRRRQLDDDRDLVRIWRVRKRHPEAFIGQPPATEKGTEPP
jgi:hypothetical protein